MSAAATRRADAIELRWTLAELPSSQHRAGLAGLVLLVRWLHDVGRASGICEVTSLDAAAATLRFDREGMKALLDAAYDASFEETATPKPWKKKGQLVEPKRKEERETTDPRGKVKRETLYVYDVVIPAGAFLAEWDPTGDDQLWVKLWRDMLWSTLRGVPATRKPFEERAAKADSKDVSKAWKQLTKEAESSVDLPSTYFVGAQAANAENVPFRDRGRFQFLLHFWPLASQVYVPAVVDNEGKSKFAGYVLAIPDVANLARFCERVPPMLRQRGSDRRAYRPADAVVDLPAQSGLELGRWMTERLENLQAAPAILTSVLGIDTMHLEKRGNNIVLLDVDRVVPTVAMLSEYAAARLLRDPRCRRQRLRNILGRLPWYEGFDELFATVPYEQTLGSTFFRRDAARLFREHEVAMEDEDDVKANDVETIIYRFVRRYVYGRLEAKHEINWQKDVGPHKETDSKLFDERRKDFQDKKHKIALDAFLGARSRTPDDFAEFFASTLSSVPQRLTEEQYRVLARALLERPAELRTLTMLALSAHA